MTAEIDALRQQLAEAQELVRIYKHQFTMLQTGEMRRLKDLRDSELHRAKLVEALRQATKWLNPDHPEVRHEPGITEGDMVRWLEQIIASQPLNDVQALQTEKDR